MANVRGTAGPERVRVSEDVPVIEEVDVCVLGGSCTGVFAAVRAARLGARVAVVEKQNHFGGVAVTTCTWHTLMDTAFERQIIAGLTEEVVERLERRDALRRVPGSGSKGFEFRPGDLKLVLDGLVVESGVQPHLHTLFSAPVVEEGRLVGVVVDGKSGRGVIRAGMFVDATGDGDLCARLGLDEYRYEALLPPTVCAFIDGWPEPAGLDLGAEIRERGARHGIEPGFVWGTVLPGTDIYMLAGTRVRGVDCSKSADLTRAEIEGRRQVAAILEVLREARPEGAARLLDFPAAIGIRDTRHVRCGYQLRGEDVLEGVRFPDAIANGSYRVDVHHQDRPGITLMYLDGRRVYAQPGKPREEGRWRPPQEADPTFYQIPLRSLVPGRFGNVVLAGRMLDADRTAFGAVRVMVNTNQTGEAAGVAAYLALSGGVAMEAVDPEAVRAELARGGSIIV
jgi:hypothetical protein